MKRTKHSLSHYKLVTCNFGQLIPVGVIETLPGDTFQHSTSLLLRLSPMLAPVMHPVSVRLHHWFVPNRMVYSGWEDFITGGPDGLGSAVPYPVNTAYTPAAGNVLDYMGVPPSRALGAGQISMIPLRGYNKIFNEFYRDEDLVTVRSQEDDTVARVSWEKDYFTTARPWSQKGPQITMPVSGGVRPVTVSNTLGISPKILKASDHTGVSGTNQLQHDASGDLSGLTGGTKFILGPNGTLEVNLDNLGAASIIDMRRAFALQRYQEARAQYGSRYTEYLRYLGVRSSDARLQRPEYLGGGKQTVAFSEVLRTGTSVDETNNPVGQMKGHGIAAMRSNRYRYFCEEHGYIFTLLSIRPRSMYNDGIARTWSRRTKEEYYQKELELIGQQAIANREVYLKGSAGGTADGSIFGYQDRYAEYRHEYSHTAGEFRDILDFWHMSRKFTDTPTLNGSFVECNPTKRIFAEQTKHSCWIMVSHSIQARRLLGKKTIGRII